VRTLLAETLDETERRVMTLHYGEDLTLDAVTRLLGLTNASGAKAYIVSARRKLSGAVRRWNTKQQREAN
jgi:DNA-directed RNA polymerase specialized sigma24 family protein